MSQRTLEDAWMEALALSEEGKIHQAVFEFESVYVDLERQVKSAKGVDGAGRVEALLVELLGKLDQEIGSHLAYLRGNLFAALEVEPSAGTGEVKKAYRKLALRYHPDKSGVSPKLFTIVQQAYETLADPARRRRYSPDQSATEWTTWRRKHAAKFRQQLSGLSSKPPVPKKLPKPDAVRGMAVGELKAHLRRLNILPRGSLERRDLEAAMLDAVGEPEPLKLIEELRAATDTQRRRRVSELSTETLRRLLDSLGQSPPAFFRRASLLAAVLDALSAPDRGFVNHLRSKTGNAAKASPPQQQQREDNNEHHEHSEADFWAAAARASAPPFVGDPVSPPSTGSSVAGGWFWGMTPAAS